MFRFLLLLLFRFLYISSTGFLQRTSKKPLIGHSYGDIFYRCVLTEQLNLTDDGQTLSKIKIITIVIKHRHIARYYGLKIYQTVAINFICSRFSHSFSYNLPGDTQQNIYKNHQYLKNVQVKALYIWNQGLFT